MTEHAWTSSGGMDVCALCLAFSVPPTKAPIATQYPVKERQLWVMVQGSWQDPVPCPRTCEETQEILAGFEVHLS